MIPQPELERRWAGIREKMEKTGVALVLATSQENFYYLTGSFYHTTKTIPDRLAIVGMDIKGNIFAVLCNLEFSLFQSQSSIKDTDTYVEFAESPIASLADLLRQKGVADNRIGMRADTWLFIISRNSGASSPKPSSFPGTNTFLKIGCSKAPLKLNFSKKEG